MELKFVDYGIEHKGFWDYGYKYWLSENYTDNKGKAKARIVITTNDLEEAINKLKELASESINMEFVKNQSFKKHLSKLPFLK